MNKENINLNDYKNIYTNIPYDVTSKAQKLDLYLPDNGNGPFPLIIYIHGGAFMKGDKQDHQVRPYLSALKEGFAIASINYRLSKEAIFPANILDARKAVRFLRKNAINFHLDSNKFVVAGGSAGGNMIEMLCTAENAKLFTQQENDTTSCAVQCGISWFGPTDFLQIDEAITQNNVGTADHNHKDSPESLYMGGQITKLDDVYVQSANPITYIHQDMPPMLLQHGNLDRIVPYQQSELFYEKAKSISKQPIEFDILEGADHGDPKFSTKENMERVMNFIKDNIY